MDYTFVTQANVQFFLDNIGDAKFDVIFLKEDNSQRKLSGYLDIKSSSRKTNVAIMTDEGWKTFNTGRVLSIIRNS